MKQIPQIIYRGILSYKNISLKGYFLDVFPNELDPKNIFEEGIEQIYDKIIPHGNLGTFFMYGYYNNNNKPVGGIDLQIYRNLNKKYSNNPMIHTWTLEKSDNKKFKELHRNKDGTFCALESIMIGRELELFLKILFKSPNNIDEYYTIWPKLYKPNRFSLFYLLKSCLYKIR